MFPINGTFSQQPANKTSKTSFQNIAQISLSSPIPVSSSLSPYASITSNLILSCGLISLKDSVRYSLNFNLGTLIKFFFLLAFFFSTGTVSLLPDISMFSGTWFTVEFQLCWVSFMLLVFASADPKDCCSCSPLYVFNFGGCSL